jgi:hypothetical protein
MRAVQGQQQQQQQQQLVEMHGAACSNTDMIC